VDSFDFGALIFTATIRFENLEQYDFIKPRNICSRAAQQGNHKLKLVTSNENVRNVSNIVSIKECGVNCKIIDRPTQSGILQWSVEGRQSRQVVPHQSDHRSAAAQQQEVPAPVVSFTESVNTIYKKQSEAFIRSEHLSGEIRDNVSDGQFRRKTEDRKNRSHHHRDKATIGQSRESIKIAETSLKSVSENSALLGVKGSGNVDSSSNRRTIEVRGDMEGHLRKPTAQPSISNGDASNVIARSRNHFLPSEPHVANPLKAKDRVEKRTRDIGENFEFREVNQKQSRRPKPKLALKEIKAKEMEARVREKMKERTRSAMEKLFKEISLLQVFFLFFMIMSTF
jgi:hypothetical protein